MKIGKNGLNLIKKSEGYRAQAYLDTGKVPTIGYGTTKGVKMGQVITEEQATIYLMRDVAGAEATVSKLVKVPLTQNQFDALVCFVYNVGSGAFSTSTLLRQLNLGMYDTVPTQLLRWNKDNGRVINGLTTRRQNEGALFQTK